MPQEGDDNVVELGKVSQKQGKTRTRDLSVEDRVHDGVPCESGAPTESRSLRQHKITLIRPLT
jgi:hypothetical protein